MNSLGLLLFYSFTLFCGTGLYGISPLSNEAYLSESPGQDTIDKQLLFNGRVWRNLYYLIRGDQFLFSDSFLPGTIMANGRIWDNVNVRYDIYNDELQTTAENGIIVQINKELVSGFNMNYGNYIYHFIRLDKDSLNKVGGYVNVLYRGDVSLFVKYRKNVLLLAVDHKYDAFEQTFQIFMMKEGKMCQVSNKHDIIVLFSNYKEQINSFIRSNKLKVSKKKPESFVPLVTFCDKLGH